MIDKDYLKAVSCFDVIKFENNPKEEIEFKANDNLDYYMAAPCQYYTLLPEVAQTISNTPWGYKPFPFPMEVLESTDNANNIIQIISVDGEWRRRLFKNSLSTWWGKWVNISTIIDSIVNADKEIQKNLVASWDRYMIVDENSHKNRRCVGNIATIEKIITEIKTGTVKMYRNKFV